MGKIILDQHLIDLGLTEDIFCKAYKLSIDELKDIISLKIIQREKTVKQNHTKSGENVWEMELFIENPSKGIPIKSVPIGMCGNSDKVISQFVEQVKLEALYPSPLSVKNKIKGRGPKKESFLKWFDRNINININHTSKKYLKGLEKEKKREERKKDLVNISLNAIKKFQNIIIKDNHLNESYDCFLKYSKLLMAYDPRQFTKIKSKIETLIEFVKEDLSEVVCSATEDNKNIISLFDSDDKLLIKIKEEGQFLKIEQYKQYSAGVNYLVNFRQRGFINQVLVLAGKAEEQIRVKKLNKFLQSISNELDHAIREIQKELNANWEKLYLLEMHDFINLDYEMVHNYGKQDLSFKNFHYSIDSLKDFEKKIWPWVEEMKQYLSEPFVVTEAVITILKLVESSPKYGVRTYAMWLGNSNAKSLSDKNLDNDFRHTLKNYSIDRIAQKIDDIIYDYEWLQVRKIGYYNNPVLFLTKAGQKILEHDTNNSFSYSQYTQSKPSIENEDKNQDNKKGINNKKDKPQEVKAVELFPYQNLIEHIENKDKKAWINFLSSAQNITQVANWDKYQISTLSVLLNKNMEGWKAVAKWKLLKHPIKYKNLERLL